MEKISIPIKTKIVAWWIIIFGIIVSSYQFLEIYPAYKLWKEYGSFGISPLSVAIFPLTFNILFCFLIGIFLFKRKKTAWNIAIIMFSIYFIGGLSGLLAALFQRDLGSLCEIPLILFLSTLIPIILLLHDRKNFWKITV